MKNLISKIIYVSDRCVYYNKDFWSLSEEEILDYIKDKEIHNIYGNIVNENDFLFEYSFNHSKVTNIIEPEDQVIFNINVGKEFIALFREEFVRTPLKEMTSLDIAQKTANLIPLILTGSFREACDLLRLYEPDEFMTRERIDKYIAMLTSADAIDYNYEETLSCEDKSEGNVDIEPSEPLEQEENQNKPETI